ARAQHVVRHEGNSRERPDPVLLPGWREQGDPGAGSADAQLDPALIVIERLIGDDSKSQFRGVELQRALLVCHRDADELDGLDHVTSSRWGLRVDSLSVQY